MDHPTPDDVLSFWFGELDADGLESEEHRTRWWQGAEAFDAECRARFGGVLEELKRTDAEAWRGDVRSELAAVVVLDQLSRNIHRGTATMYEADALARRLTEEALEGQRHLELPFRMRMFLYMPLLHAEDRRAQARMVGLMEGELGGLGPGRARDRLAQEISHTYRHEVVVRRFGRFPHRNALLGRDTTEEEAAFLEETPGGF
jgi:uncharacterized protein (DUF924 family)